jgi:hypothetical protein
VIRQAYVQVASTLVRRVPRPTGASDHSSAAVSSLIRASPPLFPKQFDPGLAGGFFQISATGNERTSPICATALPTNKPGSPFLEYFLTR